MKTDNNQTHNENNKTITFKKHAYVSTGVLSIIIFWISFFSMIIGTKMYLKNWYVVLFCFIFFFTFSIFISHYTLYYLVINQKEIIIKNLCFFWIKKTYQIENIESISKTLKRKGRGGFYGIVIYLKKPLEGYTYYMNSFKPNFWKNIEEELNKANIKFENRS
ncbi:hypothetical protein [Aquimarina algicola]|uniref:PH domain-containing protein n=1 Tax=Aquimarina algicola TaxID=2589995 RepID=A0A504IYB6_9FLAO|nr:hypothetical protein [Aquimarina algicola]TPN83487.1 hypothetical protein FHK87_19920 [Aquimarina algicola]